MPLQVFPLLDGPTSQIHFWDDWHQPRQGHLHQGNDLFAAEGTPVVAVDDGTVHFVDEALGGKSFYLHATDGTTYFGTHLRDYEGSDRVVEAGDTIGYVGHGGNAAGTPSHLHFEIHPKGQGAVDPYPILQKATRLTETKSSPVPWGTVVLVAGVGAAAIALVHAAREHRLALR